MTKKELESKYRGILKKYNECKGKLNIYENSRAYYYINKFPDRIKSWLLNPIKKKENELNKNSTEKLSVDYFEQLNGKIYVLVFIDNKNYDLKSVILKIINQPYINFEVEIIEKKGLDLDYTKYSNIDSRIHISNNKNIASFQELFMYISENIKNEYLCIITRDDIANIDFKKYIKKLEKKNYIYNESNKKYFAFCKTKNVEFIKKYLED